MKKLLFILSILTLMAYGCNRGDEQKSTSGTGMQEEQSQGTGVGSGSQDSSMESAPATDDPGYQTSEDMERQEDSMEDESMRDDSSIMDNESEEVR